MAVHTYGQVLVPMDKEEGDKQEFFNLRGIGLLTVLLLLLLLLKEVGNARLGESD